MNTPEERIASALEGIAHQFERVGDAIVELIRGLEPITEALKEAIAEEIAAKGAKRGKG